MIVLNKEQILEAVTLEEVMDSVEEALDIYEKQEYQMPLRMIVPLGDENKLLLMPCQSRNRFSTKIITLFPENPKRNLPTIEGLVLYNCPETGKVQALMDGKTVTALRTAAVTGVGIRYLADKKAASIGLIGCGIQGYYQILFSVCASGIKKVNLFDAFSNQMDGFISQLKARIPDLQIKISENADRLVTQSDIVITATTSTEPVISDDPGLFTHKLFLAVGSYQPHVRELPDAVFKLVDKIYLDTEMALEESGECIIPMDKGLIKKDNFENLGSLIAQRRQPQRGKHGTVVMKSVGMGLFDLMTASLIYRKADEKQLGTVVDI